MAVKREWHPAVAAGLGTLVLMAILNGSGNYRPLRWLDPLSTSWLGRTGRRPADPVRAQTLRA